MAVLALIFGVVLYAVCRCWWGRALRAGMQPLAVVLIGCFPALLVMLSYEWLVSGLAAALATLYSVGITAAVVAGPVALFMLLRRAARWVYERIWDAWFGHVQRRDPGIHPRTPQQWL